MYSHEEYSVLGTVLNCSLQGKNCLNSFVKTHRDRELIIPILTDGDVQEEISRRPRSHGLSVVNCYLELSPSNSVVLVIWMASYQPSMKRA